MTSTTQPSISSQETTIWLRGLISIAWADGHFDQEEQDLITALTQHELSESERASLTELLSPEELAQELGHDPHLSENFLRTAVMVALADRSYSEEEDALLHRYCQALGLSTDVLKSLRTAFDSVTAEAEHAEAVSLGHASPLQAPPEHHDVLDPVRTWLDKMEIQDPKVAHFLCRMIPPQCPFERDISLFGRKVAHIPALCKLNPLYEQLVGIRFRALSYLADDCGEDISTYC